MTCVSPTDLSSCSRNARAAHACVHPVQDRLRDKVHLQTVQILEREGALTPRMEEVGEAPPRHTPRPPSRGADVVYN